MSLFFRSASSPRALSSARGCYHPPAVAFTRSLSLNSAIGRGVRRSLRATERSGSSSRSANGKRHERSKTRETRRDDTPSGSGRPRERPATGFQERERGSRDKSRRRPSSASRGKNGRPYERSEGRDELAGRSGFASRGEDRRPPEHSEGRGEFTRRSDPASRGKNRKRYERADTRETRRQDTPSRSSREKNGRHHEQSETMQLRRDDHFQRGDIPSESSHGRERATASQEKTASGREDYMLSRLSPFARASDVTRPNEDTPLRSRSTPKIPLAVPYTTAASEFLYGTSVVLAALRARRRKLYKLYVYNAGNRVRPARDREMEDLAREAGVVVEGVEGDWVRLMDKLSAGRPHNGYILEASPLPKLPVTGLEPLPSPADAFRVTLDRQSDEERHVNGASPLVPYSSSSHAAAAAAAGGEQEQQQATRRFPLVLMLDGVVDPGNLGNILRSAAFFGVDAVAISTRNSAPLSSAALKASAGASEYMPLLSVNDASKFIDSASQNRWKFYAAVAPPGPVRSSSPSGHRPPMSSSSWRNPKYISMRDLGCPLRKQPCVLMLGGEGEGLRWNLRKDADHEVGIEGKPGRKGGLDSLNVSVAGGLLCEAFLRLGGPKEEKEERERQQERLF